MFSRKHDLVETKSYISMDSGNYMSNNNEKNLRRPNGRKKKRNKLVRKIRNFFCTRYPRVKKFCTA